MDTSAKCNITTPGPGVHVVIYELSADDKAVLDAIEGVGLGYNDATIEVPGFGQCATYLAQSSHIDASILPFDWYREIVLLGCRYHGFPGDYAKAVEDVAVSIDPDTNRSRKRWALVKRLAEYPSP